MKKVIILFMALCVPLIIHAQDIDYAEYFIDTDPGYGAATPITVTASGTDVSLDFSANMASVSEGMHFLVIRTRDDQGRWSQGVNQIFYRAPVMNVSETLIAQAEYFIDIDPGFGSATPIPVSSPGEELILTLSPDIQALSQGIHYIHIRAKDLSGRWGTGVNAIFVMVKLPAAGESNIKRVEYFMDTDPGFGLGTEVTLPSVGSDLTIDFDASLAGLADGNHVLYIRAQNALDKWGHVYAEAFSLTTTGIEEEVNSLFKVYPNPSSGLLQIDLSGQSQNGFRMKLMDLNGKLVFESECHTNPCELHLDLPAGMYLLNIESEERIITQKLILE